jgi:hypothetical protein
LALLSSLPVEELDGGQATDELVVPASDDHVPVGIWKTFSVNECIDECIDERNDEWHDE